MADKTLSSAGASSIDLRSDTVTKPSAAMRAAMAAAEVGDDVYGEDPTVNALEREVAARLGFPAAIFVTSGTMANQLAIALHTRPGETVLTEAGAHCQLFEGGAAAALSGVQIDFLPTAPAPATSWQEAALAAALKPRSLHHAPTTLVVVENTHNVGGGRVIGPSTLAGVVAASREHGLALHCDGARLWNAAAALGVDEASLVRGFDSVAVCFSKGLGAPVGSALCGSSALIDGARRLRKRWGGAMRQSGHLAAAAQYAMRHNRAALFDDHRRAASLARHLRALKGLDGAPALDVAYPDPGTNLVYFKPADGRDAALLERLRAAGILVGGMGGGWLRAVLHLDVSDAQLERAMALFERVLGSFS